MLRFRSMKNGDRSIISINDNCNRLDKKFLHFDATAYNGNGTGHGNVGGLRKWDSSSLSSGVSSGDLSSPCDCNDNEDNKMLSNGDDLCESYYVSQVCRSCHTVKALYSGLLGWSSIIAHNSTMCVCVWESPITSFVNVLLWNVPLRLHRPIVVNSRYIKWALHGIPCQAGNMRICAHLRWHFCCCCKMSTTECHVMLLFSGVLLKRLGLPQHHLPVYIPLHKILWHFPIHPANNVLSWFIFRMFGCCCCCCKCILLFCHLCISLKWYSIYYVIVSSRHTHNSHTLTHNALFSVLSFFATFEQDILEKIRECGSSVTYYGGRVLNNHHSTGASPISKAIMREIHNGDSICGVCQPHNCPQRNKLFTSFCGSDNSNSHLGKSWFCILAIHLIRCQIQLKSRRFWEIAWNLFVQSPPT